MIRLPEKIQQAWESRDPVAVLTTVNAAGIPNTIYVSCCNLVAGPRVLICDSHFRKTRENLQANQAEVSFLFFSPDFSAFQLKGHACYYTEGPVFEEGKALSQQEFGLQGVVEINVTKVYQGADQLSG